MNDIHIPQPLKNKVLQRMALRVGLCVGLMAAIGAVILLWGDDIIHLEYPYEAITYACYAVLFVLPIFITKVYRVFTDRTYMGVVTDVHIDTTADVQMLGKLSYNRVYIKNTILLTIETPSGKIIQKAPHESPAKLALHLDTYHVGDRVLHLHGSGVTVVLPSPADTHCTCALCANKSPVAERSCVHCGMPLVK